MDINKEKSRLIKEALIIVDKLGDYDANEITIDDIEDIEKLVKNANRLKKNNYWVLK